MLGTWTLWVRSLASSRRYTTCLNDPVIRQLVELCRARNTASAAEALLDHGQKDQHLDCKELGCGLIALQHVLG